MPHLRNLTVLGVDWANDMLTIETRSAAASAACPGCGVMSRRGHGGYRRSIDDTPLAGVRVVIGVTVRRFTCRELSCERVTFVEQIDGLTTPHSRSGPPLRAALTAIAVALAGRAGVRLARSLGVTIGRDTLLSLLRGLPDPPVGEVTVLGVDLSRSWDYPEVRAGAVRVRWWRVDPGCCGRPRSG